MTDIDQLEDDLSKPTEPLIDILRQNRGDIIVLGVGGKMGPTLARMAKRASETAGVSRRVTVSQSRLAAAVAKGWHRADLRRFAES